MIKALFWCFLVLISQLGLLHYVDRRVLGMTFGGGDTAADEITPQSSLTEE
ncbi:hypothetical protein [uncultured Halomonas sp.]|uniref:hypothetical protein n=1 Tax=uncultured Halomonas sp. TaxID=173971 RepID=UPI00261E32D0|nr:hypothetical protein [uncultured Halomonas sp.]